MDRRNFLISSAAALGASASAFGSPSDTIQVAVVGIGGRARDHISSLSRQENVKIAAICDIDDSHIANGLKQIANLNKPAPQTYKDVRKLLEDKSIDAITIATPNHWHTLITIWACQAGKDVYVEKPCSYNMFEAKQIVAAARKYNRMVQQGSQIRSSVAVEDAVQKMRDGLIGDIYLSRGLCFKFRDTIGRKPVEPVPAGVDYDLWTGPSPMHQFTMNRFHYNWHWFWDTGNGDLGNQGIHEIDIARWGLGVKYPTKVSAIGGHFMFDDDQETPNTLNCAFEFNENGKHQMMEFEVRHWYSNGEASVHDKPRPASARPMAPQADTPPGAPPRGPRALNSIGNLFYGSKGYLAVDSYSSYKSWLGPQEEPGPADNKGGDHFANFFEAVRTRKREGLHAEAEEGAISTTLVHLANISYRLGRTLHFDAASYSVTGDSEANKMFTRAYRKPFVVPEKV
ncbi:MAG TPA: Gfo/Idh/MocA family oxidoreductase [Bryobacteraceae bacterium]|nr:Gfo/Idh/MocA family oxidoreductase [Bryobacteraceae bacterium]